MNDELPTLPTDPKVMEITDSHAPKTCNVCGDDADFYVIVTNTMVNDRVGTDLGYDEWPVNDYLCKGCFADAPRVKSWEDLPTVKV